MKACRTCGMSKPVAAFYRRRRTADGRETECAECCRQRNERFRAARPEVQAQYLASHRDDHYRVVVAERATSPEKTRARRAVEKALEAGRIIRPDACSDCGRLGRVEGHHDDYAQKLDVRWLCSKCHHAEHRRREQAA